MSEGSPTDPTPPSEIVTDPTAAIGATARHADDSEQLVDQNGKTVEEVEAIWKNRVAGKDRAHAAAEQALREERDRIAAERDALKREREQQQQSTMSEADRYKAQAEQFQRELEQERQQRVIDLRTVKYSAAAEHLDTQALFAMDEGKLAALNARLTGEAEPAGSGGPIDPNMAPKRSAAPPSSPAEKTKDDLLADLQKHEPEFTASLGIPHTSG